MNNAQRLMGARLGFRIDPDPQNHLSNLDKMREELNARGGDPQQLRMIQDKRRTLDRAVWYSYQGAFIEKLDGSHPKVKGLINPNKLKQDYDDKIISIGFEYDFHCGDVFEWINTNTHWLIYLQDLTELAYFRGDIRRCNYTIEWEDETGRHKTYCAVRGPVETKINYIQKHGISVDTPNHSINILMPKNDYTLKYFKRYTRFYLQDGTDEHKVCWRVEAVDWISMPGILEINGVEYYANEIEDDIDVGIVGAKIESVQDPNENSENNLIKGKIFIKPKTDIEYEFLGEIEDKWEIIGNNIPVIAKIDNQNSKKIILQWTKSYSGQFELKYGDYSKTIVVESLF